MTDRVADIADEIAWLVEFPSSGDAYHGGKRVGPATPTQYYCAIPKRDNVLSRTADPNEAMRFARKQDAEAMVASLDSDSLFQVGVKSGGFASEHIWLAWPAAQGMSASGQDPQGLEAKPASPVLPQEGCAHD